MASTHPHQCEVHAEIGKCPHADPDPSIVFDILIEDSTSPHERAALRSLRHVNAHARQAIGASATVNPAGPHLHIEQPPVFYTRSWWAAVKEWVTR